MKVNFVTEMTRFNRYLRGNHLSASAQLLWLKLFLLWNEAGFPDWLQIDVKRMMLMVQLRTPKSLLRARDELIEAGLLIKRRQSNKRPNCYQFVTFATGQFDQPTSKQVEQIVDVDQLYCKKYSIIDSETDSISDSETDMSDENISGKVTCFDHESDSYDSSGNHRGDQTGHQRDDDRDDQMGSQKNDKNNELKGFDLIQPVLSGDQRGDQDGHERAYELGHQRDHLYKLNKSKANEKLKDTHTADFFKQKENEAFKESTSSKKKVYGEFGTVRLTDEEIDKLKEQFPHDYENWIKRLDMGKVMMGYKYQSDYAAILKWHLNDQEQERNKSFQELMDETLIVSDSWQN